MKKLLLVCVYLSMCLFASDNDLVVSKTDILIANTICIDKGGVKEVEVGGYFTCNNNENGDESKLLELSNINVVSTLSK